MTMNKEVSKMERLYEQKRSDGQMMSIMQYIQNVTPTKRTRELRKSLLIMKETNKSLVKEKNNLTITY